MASTQNDYDVLLIRNADDTFTTKLVKRNQAQQSGGGDSEQDHLLRQSSVLDEVGQSYFKGLLESSTSGENLMPFDALTSVPSLYADDFNDYMVLSQKEVNTIEISSDTLN